MSDILENWGTLTGETLSLKDLEEPEEEVVEDDEWSGVKHPPLDSSLMCRATDPSVDKPMTLEEAFAPLSGGEKFRVRRLHVDARISRLTALSKVRGTERREKRREGLGSSLRKSEEKSEVVGRVKNERVAEARKLKKARASRNSPPKHLEKALGFSADEVSKSLLMLEKYQAKLAEYYHGDYQSHQKQAGKAYYMNLRFLKEAADTADELGMKYEHYIEAQFYWLKSWFGRHPEIVELQGGKGEWPAKRRAEEYLKEGFDPDNPKHRVRDTYNSAGSTPMTVSEIVKHFNSQLEKRCRTQGEYERAVLIQWGHPDADGPYPLPYLVHNELWQELDAEGMFDGPPLSPMAFLKISDR